MGKKDTSTAETATAQPQLTPIDIQQKEFRVSRFGGYKMRDVDEFLDRVTDSFTALTTEIERLRSGSAAPIMGTPDLDDVARQADEIIARARAEAARITSDAKGSASAVAVVAAASGPAERAAVSAFLSREREFLQSLAGLVQEHAEAVKGMAKSARAAADRPAARPAGAVAATSSTPATPSTLATPATSPAAVPATSPTEEDAERSAAEQSASTAPEPVAEAPPEREEPSREEPEREEPTRVPEPQDTVRIEEPAPAGAPRREGDPDGDRSLRELFWGED